MFFIIEINLFYSYSYSFSKIYKYTCIHIPGALSIILSFNLAAYLKFWTFQFSIYTYLFTAQCRITENLQKIRQLLKYLVLCTLFITQID